MPQLEEMQGLLDVNGELDRVFAQRERLKTAYKQGKRRFSAFKVSPAGIFTLARWLPLQDVVSDALVTFCVADVPVCSNPGLLWDESNPWWGRLSLAFMTLPYLILWLLMAPLILGRSGRWAVPRWVLLPAWILFGIPTCIVADVVLFVIFPIKQPSSSLLLNFLRLRMTLEAGLEAPTQTLLQTRILFVKVFKLHESVGWQKPWTLVFSIVTSVVTFGLTLSDVRDLSKQQEISFCQALADILFVGLGWKAPLLHTLSFQDAVDYGEEGLLTDEHCEQIARASIASSTLRRLNFSSENDLSDSGLRTLLRTLDQNRERLNSIVFWKRSSSEPSLEDGGKKCALFAPSLADEEDADSALIHFAKTLPRHLDYLQVKCSDDTTITDRGLVGLSQVLPQSVREVRLNFANNSSFTDQAFRSLAKALPKSLCRANLHFPSSTGISAGVKREVSTALSNSIFRVAIGSDYSVGGFRGSG